MYYVVCEIYVESVGGQSKLTRSRYHGRSQYRLSSSHCLSSIHSQCHFDPTRDHLPRPFWTPPRNADWFLPDDDIPLHRRRSPSSLRRTQQTPVNKLDQFGYLMDRCWSQRYLESDCIDDVPLRLHFCYDLGTYLMDISI